MTPDAHIHTCISGFHNPTQPQRVNETKMREKLFYHEKKKRVSPSHLPWMPQFLYLEARLKVLPRTHRFLAAATHDFPYTHKQEEIRERRRREEGIWRGVVAWGGGAMCVRLYVAQVSKGKLRSLPWHHLICKKVPPSGSTKARGPLKHTNWFWVVTKAVWNNLTMLSQTLPEKKLPSLTGSSIRWHQIILRFNWTPDSFKH